MKKEMNKFLAKSGRIIAILAITSITMFGMQSAAIAGTGNGYVKCAGSHGGTTFVYSDSVGGTKLATSSVIQFIYAGSDNTINDPDMNGNPTGDDILISSGTVGTPWNTSGEFLYYLKDMNDYAHIYVRAWNASTIAAATKYGNPTTTYQVNGGTPTPSPFVWNVPDFATTTNKPTAQPTITVSPSTLTVTVLQGQDAASQTFAVGNSGSGTLNYSITDNQTWLSESPASGTIAAGEPNETITTSFNTASLAAGTYSATITVSDPNATNNPRTVTVNLTVYAPVNITNPSLASGTVGISYNQTLSATGGTGSYAWSIISGALPNGLSLNSATGVISGTPTTQQTTNPTFRATSGSLTGDKLLSITINGPTGPSITRLEMTAAPGVAISSAQVGDGISIVGTNFGATQGSSTITFNGIPATSIYYWSADKIDLQVPTGATTGNVIVTVSGQSASAPLTIIPAGTPLNITTTSLPNGTTGTAYNQTLAATGGTGTYTWALASGSLPAGLSLSTAGIISGTPTAVGTSSFTVQVSDGTNTDSQALSITIGSGNPGPSISGINPNSGYPGQTVVISGTNFGSPGSTSLVRFGTTKAYPAVWTDNQIVVSVPTGLATGEIDVYVVTSAGSDNEPFTVLGDGTSGTIIIDDYEGGSVDSWLLDNDGDGTPDSGYYAFGAGITPTNESITANLRKAEALHDGSWGAKVLYSYSASGPGYGGWGGKLAEVHDLTKAEKIEMNIRWDGSANSFKLSLVDTDGTAISATVANSTLTALLGSYGTVSLNRSAFAYDADGSGAGADASFDWSKVANYNLVYNTNGTSATYQQVDNILATFGGGSTSSEVVITSITPASGPAGTTVEVVGLNFGASMGQSMLIFENLSTGATYQCDINSWDDTVIHAVVPELANTGDYKVRVIKVAIVAGTITAQESNRTDFRITAAAAADGVVFIYPNPFNPLSTNTAESVANMIWNTGGATNMYAAVYDMTAHLVKKNDNLTTGATTWNGYDENGKLAGDGAYLVRVVNKDNGRLIAKGKALVIKH